MVRKNTVLLMTVLIAILLVVLVGCGSEVKEEAGEKTSEKVIEEKKVALEGIWAGEVGDPFEGWEITFSGEKISIKTPDEDVWYKGTFKINTNVSPNQIDALSKESSPPKYAGKTALGIYKIEGNTLTYAINEPGTAERPTAFEPTGGTVVLMLKKQ